MPALLADAPEVWAKEELFKMEAINYTENTSDESRPPTYNEREEYSPLSYPYYEVWINEVQRGHEKKRMQ